MRNAFWKLIHVISGLFGFQNKIPGQLAYVMREESLPFHVNIQISSLTK